MSEIREADIAKLQGNVKERHQDHNSMMELKSEVVKLREANNALEEKFRNESQKLRDNEHDRLFTMFTMQEEMREMKYNERGERARLQEKMHEHECSTRTSLEYLRKVTHERHTRFEENIEHRIVELNKDLEDSIDELRVSITALRERQYDAELRLDKGQFSINKLSGKYLENSDSRLEWMFKELLRLSSLDGIPGLVPGLVPGIQGYKSPGSLEHPWDKAKYLNFILIDSNFLLSTCPETRCNARLFARLFRRFFFT